MKTALQASQRLMETKPLITGQLLTGLDGHLVHVPLMYDLYNPFPLQKKGKLADH